MLTASENLCTATNYRGSYREIINVDKKSQKVLYVTVIPMKPGKHQITVTARSEYYRDGIEKQLLVVVRLPAPARDAHSLVEDT